MRHATIIAGGSGTRLWPLSRHDRPKQLLPLLAGPHPTLLARAASRALGLVDAERLWVCTTRAHRDATLAALPQLAPERLIAEPMGRDTACAIGLLAVHLLRADPDAVMVVLTADHLIEPESVLRERVALACRLVEADHSRLVTFSITPTRAETGYGYVERGTPITGVPGAEGAAFRVSRLVEKPVRHRAEAFVASGVFGWNSGMFVWRASTIMRCLERYLPEAHAGLRRIGEALGTPHADQTLGEVYPTLPAVSIDYAVMEPAASARGDDRIVSVCTVLMDVSWRDVGSWEGLAETLPADAAGNRASGFGSGGGPELVDASDNVVVTSDPAHTVALVGCEGLVVVHTPEATLVVPRDQAARLKELAARLPDRVR